MKRATKITPTVFRSKEYKKVIKLIEREKVSVIPRSKGKTDKELAEIMEDIINSDHFRKQTQKALEQYNETQRETMMEILKNGVNNYEKS